MTVPTTSTTVTYSGNGVTTIWTFPFIGVAPADLTVTVISSLGIPTVLVSTQYAVTINPVPVGGLWGLGGSVTYPLSGSPLATGNKIAITRGIPYIQVVSIANQGAFYPQTVERALDLLELQIQQLVTDYNYTIKVPLTDTVPPNTLPTATLRANGILGFDSSGQPIITTIPTNVPTPGQFATPRRIVTTGTATININSSDSFGGVSIYQSTSPVTTLQLPVGFGPFPVFDAGGNAGTFPITILPPVGKTINGQTGFLLAYNFQSATFYNDGVQILIG